MDGEWANECDDKAYASKLWVIDYMDSYPYIWNKFGAILNMGTNKRQTSVRKLLLIGKEKCENDWDRTLSQIIGWGGEFL